MNCYWMYVSYLIFILFYSCNIILVSSTSNTHTNKAPKLNTDLLPDLETILTELDLYSHLHSFIKYGVTETRYLLRLTKMDFHLLEIDYQLSKEDIQLLKDKINELVTLATISDAPPPVVNKERETLRYGRIYLPHAVQSYEYILASFGSSPPLGPQSLCISDDFYGCESTIDNSNTSSTKYTNCFMVVGRGECTFLQKATIAHSIHHAKGLIIINNQDRIEAYSSGLGVVENVTESQIYNLTSFPILSLSNTTLSKLQFSLQLSLNQPLVAYIVPLKCGSSGKCEAVTPEEKSVESEVTTTCGVVKISSELEGKSVDFVTSTFGGVLTTQKLCLLQSLSEYGCEPIPPVTIDASTCSSSSNFALLVKRGVCTFDIKANYTQAIGAKVLIIVDKDDSPLQRIGGQDPLQGYIGMPSILITSASGKYIEQLSSKGLPVHIELKPSSNSLVSDMWMELSTTEWDQEETSLLIQINHLLYKYKGILGDDKSNDSEILNWLERKKYLILEPPQHEETNKEEL